MFRNYSFIFLFFFYPLFKTSNSSEYKRLLWKLPRIILCIFENIFLQTAVSLDRRMHTNPKFEVVQIESNRQ